MSPGQTDERTLSGFLDSIATTYSTGPALLFKRGLKTDTWTYEDLRDRANCVTHWLQSQGIGKGDRVVLWAPNSPWWVAVFFGILRNGSVLVPLDTRSSPDFVNRVIDQSEPRIAIVTSGSLDDWTFELPAVGIEQLVDMLPDDGPEALPEIAPDD